MLVYKWSYSVSHPWLQRRANDDLYLPDIEETLSDKQFANFDAVILVCMGLLYMQGCVGVVAHAKLPGTLRLTQQVCFSNTAL